MIRGVIQVGVSLFFMVLILRMPEASKEVATIDEFQYLRSFATIATVALAVTALLGAARLTVGVLDLVPRRSVSGTVVSLKERRAGDVLPHLAQRALFENRSNGIDRRKSRTEVVLETDAGPRQWTVRSHRTARDLRIGAQVNLSVTPLTGYVARVETLSP